MAELYSPKLFSDDNLSVDSTIQQRKTRKSQRKPASKISRKALNYVKEDLKKEYRKYVNSIQRRKNCKVKTFREFVKKRIGKKKRQSVKSSSKESSLDKSETVATSTASEESVAEESTVEKSTAEEPVAEASAPSAVEEPTVSSPPVAEEQPSSNASPDTSADKGSIVKSVTDALGLSSPKEESKSTGGKKSKRNKRRSGKK